MNSRTIEGAEYLKDRQRTLRKDIFRALEAQAMSVSQLAQALEAAKELVAFHVLGLLNGGDVQKMGYQVTELPQEGMKGKAEAFYIAVTPSNEGKVIGISFFQGDKLPPPMASQARSQGYLLGGRLIAVKTLVGSPPTYKFDTVIPTPRGIRDYMHQLALEDGVNLDEALRNAFHED